MVSYPALFEPDAEKGGYVVTFPDFGYGVTQGESMAEADRMARDLLACTIGDFVEVEKDLPKPGSYRGKKYRQVALPAATAMKVELYLAFRKSGIRKSELGRRAGIAKTNIDRLFDLHHASRVDRIEAAFRALGKTLVIDVTDAA